MQTNITNEKVNQVHIRTTSVLFDRRTHSAIFERIIQSIIKCFILIFHFNVKNFREVRDSSKNFLHMRRAHKLLLSQKKSSKPNPTR